MTSPVITRTPYERRLDVVASTIRDHSTVDSATADNLAVEILTALNSIPEKIR